MRLTEVNSENVKTITTRELVSLHYRIHQLYSIAEKREPSPGYMAMLVEKHEILAAEMEKRSYKHTTPLTREEKIKSFMRT